MNKDRKQRTRKEKLTLAKESVRKLAGPDLANVAGGGGGPVPNGKTVTFPLCCRTA